MRVHLQTGFHFLHLHLRQPEAIAFFPERRSLHWLSFSDNHLSFLSALRAVPLLPAKWFSTIKHRSLGFLTP